MYQIDRIKQLVSKSFEKLGVLPTPRFTVQRLDDGRFVVDIFVSWDVSETREVIRRVVDNTISAEGYVVLVSCELDTSDRALGGKKERTEEIQHVAREVSGSEGKVFTEKDVKENYVPRESYDSLCAVYEGLLAATEGRHKHGTNPVIEIIQHEFDLARDQDSERYISQLLGNVLATRIAHQVGMFHVEQDVAKWKADLGARGKVLTEKEVNEDYVPRSVHKQLQSEIERFNGRVEHLEASLAGYKAYKIAVEQAISHALKQVDAMQLETLLKGLREI